MAHLTTRIFIGNDAADATAQLMGAIDDGSFPIMTAYSQPTAMWITHEEVTPGAMQAAYYKLHVTAWVESSGTGVLGDTAVNEVSDATDEEGE